ncbi:WD40 repeat domain-containing protein [Bradyrhizobium yuanmingense]|uniref:WD40 repeat domain-containing protein n=1 Tax=Bradyrhizobium yuanmingense TaxID=108015 RepID=UPI0023BA1C01|nr:WD40 repeat domain-containing protein [Bradyrhizobium yuanmingense]MDF0495346.1 WD40 repeat domain-containing protein [Bradyrhizobium yuanmingense]
MLPLASRLAGAWQAAKAFLFADAGGRLIVIGGAILAAMIALWSHSYIRSAAPLILRDMWDLASTPEEASSFGVDWSSRDAAVTGLLWTTGNSLTSEGVIAVSRRRSSTPAFFNVDGRRTTFVDINGLRSTPPDTRGFAPWSTGLAAPDGEFYSAGGSNHVLTPGGIFAVDAEGALMVTGAASVRNPDGSATRGFELAGPQNDAVWRIVSTGAGAGAQLIFKSGSQVTALAATPPDVIAATVSGQININGNEEKRPAIAADVPGHNAPVFALAAVHPGQRAVAGATLASIATDRSIKLWRWGPNEQLVSLDVSLPETSPELVLAPGGLALSPSGSTLMVRTPAGAIFVARTIGESRVSQSLAERRYRVQFVVDQLERRDVSTVELERAIAGQTNPFSPDEVRRIREAIEKSVPVTVLSQESVDELTAVSLAARGIRFLSFIPTPLRLREIVLPARATAATLSDDGRWLYAAGADCSIREVDLAAVWASSETGRETPVASELSGHGGIVTHLALSPYGTWLAAASIDGRVRIHRIEYGRIISRLPLSDLPTGPPCPSTAPIAIDVPPIRPAQQQQQQAQPPLIAARTTPAKVTINFAGKIDRKDVIAFANILRDAGFDTLEKYPDGQLGGNRTTSARNLNVVRYGSVEDEAEAQRLATLVSGRSPAGKPVKAEVSPTPTVPPGTLEVWVSN